VWEEEGQAGQALAVICTRGLSGLWGVKEEERA